MRGFELNPFLPNPPHDEYLYVRLITAVGFLTIFDENSRELGFDEVSGQWVQQIPNSTVISSRNTEEIIVMNPKQEYVLVVTAGGNTVFDLFVSRSSNTADVIASVEAGGTLKMGESRTYVLDSDSMQMKNRDAGFENIVRAPDFDLLLLVTLWGCEHTYYSDNPSPKSAKTRGRLVRLLGHRLLWRF